MTAPTEVLARFAVAGEHLDPGLREELLAFGPPVVPGLLRFVEDEELWLEESPGQGWPPIHAVELLGELKAPEAAEPMLRALCETTWDDIIHDRLVQHLPKLGVAVLEPALAELTPDTPEDVRHSLCCVLANVGFRDPRVYVELCKFSAEDELLGSACLADYGDPVALPIIAGAIADFEPDFDSQFGAVGLADLIDAHERLGTPLSPELRRRTGELFAAFKEHRRAPAEPVRGAAEKLGRNDLCHCGSGLKFKKCCMGKATTTSTSPERGLRGRTVHRGGQSFIASKGVTDAQLDAASDFVEAKRRGNGPAQQIADFARPLIDAAQDDGSLQNALNLGMLFWNLAVCKDEKTRAEMLDDIVRTAHKGEVDAREFRTLAAEMVDRHRRMFPEMHRR